ncbi:hypothetical protein [Fluviibacter phosphoraccumulans]|uniref:Sulfotransferase family protein n=1 Tax=Fluviibacter phosphoraccumulans TaxID=1751046 RepID=A0A7R6R3F1_9RHOO|nr:hypothetical protein [Fluviibacter phosphoraccumulans]BBU69661.1 hypothetical protein ICHIAU1_19440 [Fluviibacter phosphoraccumulans]BBU71155.1 hypothetical protein ICHIJ1_10740 [Fluviibacter phosphoraccumulans]
MQRQYNTLNPLVSLHIPKCAGQSFRVELEIACQGKYSLDYHYPDVGVFLPANSNVARKIIHGHFVRWKDAAVEQVFPEADQFITIVRDPYDVCISAYFYGKDNLLPWAMSLSIEDFLCWWLDQDEHNGPLLGALPSIESFHLIEDYCNNFICIGAVDKLERFYSELGAILNVRFDPRVFVNRSNHVGNVPDLRKEFKRKFSLDYELFNFVAAR